MAEVGGMLTTAVVKMVGKQIGSAIGGQIKLQWDFDDDLENMKMTLETIEALLKDAERRSVTEESVRLWLKRLKNAMYDISDMIDVFGAKTKKKQLGGMIPNLTTISPKIALANKMKTIREELREITNQHFSFRFAADSCHKEQEVITDITDKRATSSKVEEALIVGRTEEKERIVSSLSERMAEDTIILPIYGIGGIGKTTLAKLFFNETRFQDYSKVWVYVSQTFDLRKIGNSIISQVSKSESQLTEMEMINRRLDELLAGRTVLIVLDDLWEKNQFLLGDLKTTLKFGRGSKLIVIVTTRDEDIAKKICTTEPYKLEPLTDDMCWKIIKEKSAFAARDDKEQLEDIGREIASKCGGVALAAQSLGYTLQSMKFDEWVSVRNNDIWNASTTYFPYHNVLASLRLSCSNMLPYLRLCFAYCAIFPKGHTIVKDHIIHQWSALGFIEPSDVFSTRQLGEAYVRQLLGLSFLQQTKAPSTTRFHNEDSTFLIMHDLVHDVARSILFDEVLDSGKNINIGGSNCRYGILADCSKPLELITPSPAKIRALHFLGCGKIELRGVAFSCASFLRVLDLSECSIQRLPASIGQLKQLRYLNAPGIKSRMIPKCVTKLSKLEFLSLCRSRALSALPESIGEIEGLMHLDLSGCSRLEELPKSFGKLRRLVHLNLSNCYRVKVVSECIGDLTNLEYLNLSQCPKIGFLPRTLGSLTELKYLNLSDCFGIKELPKSFHKLKNLVHLDLSYCNCVKDLSEALDGLAKLQYLNLSYCRHYGNQFHLRRLPEVMGNLKSLRHLHLSGFLDNIFGSQPRVMDTLLEIGYLKLSKFEGNIFEQLPPDQSHNFIECIGALSNLEHLNLSNNVSLYKVPGSLGNLRKLHTLDLTGCIGLLWLPESIGEIDSLKFIFVKDLLRLNSTLLRFKNSSTLLPNFVVQSVDERSSNLVQLLHANPAELEISSLENVKSTKEAERIKLLEKRMIVKLKFNWTIYTKRFVDDMEVLRELVPPSTVKFFELRGYNSISFPTWLMDIALYLPNLVEIKIVDLMKCNILPLGQLPKLQILVLGRMESVTKIDADFCGGARAFPQLKIFILYSMKGLHELDTTYCCGEDGVNEFMFPNLQCLKIHHCPNLIVKPVSPRAVWWDIECSDNVISSWGGSVQTGPSSSSSPVTNLVVSFCKVPLHQWSLLQHLPALSHLTIHWCTDLTSSSEIIQGLHSLKSLSLDGNEQAELPEWLGDLPSLQKLEITMYPLLTELQEKIRQLISLQSLTLSSCQMLTSLGEWLGDLTSLQELQISHCQRLNSLPEGMRHLTSLSSLHLSYCESISDLPEWLGNLTSLKTLEIWECRGITSLPESIEQLTMLEHLEISGCPELRQWCELEENKMKLAHVKYKSFW